MITVKNEIFEIEQYFVAMQKMHGSDQLSVMDAYRINRLMKKLDSLNEEYAELKKGLLLKFGTPTEDNPNQIRIPEEKAEEFSEEMENLLGIEHSLDMPKLPFPKKLTDGLSAANLDILDMFFDLSTLESESPAELSKETAIEQ